MERYVSVMYHKRTTAFPFQCLSERRGSHLCGLPAAPQIQRTCTPSSSVPHLSPRCHAPQPSSSHLKCPLSSQPCCTSRVCGMIPGLPRGARTVGRPAHPQEVPASHSKRCAGPPSATHLQIRPPVSCTSVETPAASAYAHSESFHSTETTVHAALPHLRTYPKKTICQSLDVHLSHADNPSARGATSPSRGRWENCSVSSSPTRSAVRQGAGRAPRMQREPCLPAATGGSQAKKQSQQYSRGRPQEDAPSWPLREARHPARARTGGRHRSHSPVFPTHPCTRRSGQRLTGLLGRLTARRRIHEIKSILFTPYCEFCVLTHGDRARDWAHVDSTCVMNSAVDHSREWPAPFHARPCLVGGMKRLFPCRCSAIPEQMANDPLPKDHTATCSLHGTLHRPAHPLRQLPAPLSSLGHGGWKAQLFAGRVPQRRPLVRIAAGALMSPRRLPPRRVPPRRLPPPLLPTLNKLHPSLSAGRDHAPTGNALTKLPDTNC